MRLDDELIYEIQNGNENSFSMLYHKYQAQLFAICLRYASDKSTAEDFLQEGLIKVFKNLDKYNPDKGAFLPWASRVMVNTCLNHLRKLKVVNETTNLESVKIEAQNLSSIDLLSFNEMLEIIKNLPEGYRTVFNMFVMDGYSHAEIAETLGISIGTSKSQLSKAKKHIAEQLRMMNSWSKTS